MIETMTNDFRVVDGQAGAAAYLALRGEYLATLAAPLDDMWAAFSDDGERLGLMIDGTTAGCASIDEDGVLQHLFVRSEFDHRGEQLLQAVLDDRGPTAITVATVDPGLLSLAVPRAASITPVSLMYHHEQTPLGPFLGPLHRAGNADHDDAVDFMERAAGGPRDWVTSYLGRRIERGELYLHRVDGRIAAAGERRLDERTLAHAQLGIVVDPERRGQGLGSQLMGTLVTMSDDDGLIALCSTDPDNHPARRAIRRAGFRSRHRVFRLDPDSTGRWSLVGDQG